MKQTDAIQLAFKRETDPEGPAQSRQDDRLGEPGLRFLRRQELPLSRPRGPGARGAGLSPPCAFWCSSPIRSRRASAPRPACEAGRGPARQGAQGRRLRSQRRGLRPGDVACRTGSIITMSRSTGARVAPYVDRLLAAEALVFSFPVWNMGFPAILKGFVDKVFLPGVSFTLSENGDYNPCLHNIKRLGVVCTYGGARMLTFFMGDPPRRFLTRSMRRDLRARRAVRLCRPLRHGPHEARAAGGVPRRRSRRSSRPGKPGPQPRLTSVPKGFLALDGPAMLRSVRPRRNP